jgi:hypothetical protein
MPRQLIQLCYDSFVLRSLSRVRVVTIRRGLDCILDLLATYTHRSELQVITALSLRSILYNSLLHPLLSSVCYSHHESFPGNGF